MILRSIFALAILTIACKPLFASGDFVERLILAKLQEELAQDKQELELQYDRPSLVSKLNEREDNIESIKISQLNRNKRKFSITVMLNNNQKERISGRYIGLIEVPVAANFIQFGEVIEPHMLSYIKIRQDRLKKNLANKPNEIIGMQAKQNISSGAFIKKIDLQKQTVVKKNDPINIVYHSGAISLKAKGIAIDGGAVGDIIKAKNDVSGVAVIGKIVSKNTIKVNGD